MEYALSAAELLNVWERARSLPPTDGALLLMASADAGISREQLAQFSIGRRDAELLRLREKLFGSRMAGRADCPACGQPMEMNFTVAEVQAAPPSESAEHFTEQFRRIRNRFSPAEQQRPRDARPRRGRCDPKASPCAALRRERDPRRPADPQRINCRKTWSALCPNACPNSIRRATCNWR